ncbi:hypothetical protein C8Q77DRAFT_778393 [Trametes polyzona]|nr:hypothetical protein C8Q77DRAFT_778393 [Trametes polyzona]
MSARQANIHRSHIGLYRPSSQSATGSYHAPLKETQSVLTWEFHRSRINVVKCVGRAWGIDEEESEGGAGRRGSWENKVNPAGGRDSVEVGRRMGLCMVIPDKPFALTFPQCMRCLSVSNPARATGGCLKLAQTEVFEACRSRVWFDACQRLSTKSAYPHIGADSPICTPPSAVCRRLEQPRALRLFTGAQRQHVPPTTVRTSDCVSIRVHQVSNTTAIL